MLQSQGIQVTTLNISPIIPSLFSFAQLIKILRKERPDVVQTWMYHADFLGGLAARLAGIDAVVWGIRHSTLEPGKSKRTTIWIAKILGMISKWIPKRIAVNAKSALDVHLNMGYFQKKMCLIPNGYDLTKFKPNIENDDFSQRDVQIDRSISLIGMVGRFNPQKDHLNLIQALAIIHSRKILFQCLLIGDDVDDNNHFLTKKINELNLLDTVRLTGSRTDIPMVMNSLDLHVLSSSSEAFPNVVAEAMACGTPCVVTDVGDAAYIVGDTGWIVPPKDPEALANAIMAALAEKGAESWDIRCKKARARIEENFSIERMVQSYHELWEQVTKQS